MAYIKNSKNCNERYQESLKAINVVRLKVVACLCKRQNNEDHADISHRRQQQKVCIVDEVLLA
jgi:hypothetical protein